MLHSKRARREGTQLLQHCCNGTHTHTHTANAGFRLTRPPGFFYMTYKIAPCFALHHHHHLFGADCQVFPHPNKDNVGGGFQFVLQNIEDAQCCAHLRTYLEGALARGLTMDRHWFKIYGDKGTYVDSCRVEDGACGDSPPSFQDNNPGEPVYVADNDAMAKAQAYICSKPSCSYGPNVEYWALDWAADERDRAESLRSKFCEADGELRHYCDLEFNKNFCADVLMCGQDDPFVSIEPEEGMSGGDPIVITGRTNGINGVIMRVNSPMAYSAGLRSMRPVFDYFNTNSTEMFACDRTGACFLLLRAYV